MTNWKIRCPGEAAPVEAKLVEEPETAEHTKSYASGYKENQGESPGRDKVRVYYGISQNDKFEWGLGDDNTNIYDLGVAVVPNATGHPAAMTSPCGLQWSKSWR